MELHVDVWNTWKRQLEADVGDPRFIAHLVLHELEAWLFVDVEACVACLPDGTDIGALRRVRAQLAPEEINEGTSTCPSRRLLNASPRYDKASDGPLALDAIGIPGIRGQCPHFDAWLQRLLRTCRPAAP